LPIEKQQQNKIGKTHRITLWRTAISINACGTCIAMEEPHSRHSQASPDRHRPQQKEMERGHHAQPQVKKHPGAWSPRAEHGTSAPP
jgi:hypothetical protein